MNENYDVQEFEEKDTILDDSSEKENDFDDIDEIITPDEESQYTENQQQDKENESTNEPFVSVQYNHKNRDFTKEEAIQFIQKGMHTENLRTKLEYLAKSQGVDVNTLVDKIVTAPENEHRNRLEMLYGKDSENVEIGMAIFRQKQSEEYKKLMGEHEKSVEKQENIKNVNLRLADEYITLKTEIPNAPQYSELPDSVIIDAASGNRDLYSAYLHYLNKEKIKIEAANKTKEAANAASTGKMGTSSGNNLNSTERKFLSGLWQR
ncbi:MAG: hypothetical protein IKT42_02465 [Clostridia bacterium]|nr:hypothetical protein [Clostridia bacterium]